MRALFIHSVGPTYPVNISIFQSVSQLSNQRVKDLIIVSNIQATRQISNECFDYAVNMVVSGQRAFPFI